MPQNQFVIPARSYSWRRIPERTASCLIAVFPVAPIVSAVLCLWHWLLVVLAGCLLWSSRYYLRLACEMSVSNIFHRNFLCSRSQWPRGQRRWSVAAPLLELRVRLMPGHGCLSFVSVVYCQVEVFASGWSLVQRSATECDHEALIMRKPWPTKGCGATGKKWFSFCQG
jgi:hypothetical protein